MDKTVAILARTNRALRPFEQALTEAEIKYHLVGRSGYWQQPEIKAGLTYVQCALFPADYAIGAAIRAPFWPSKYLPKSKLSTRLKDLQTEGQPTYWHLLTKEPRTLVEPKNLGALQEFVDAIYNLKRYANLPAGEAVKQILLFLKAWDTYAEQDEIDNSPVDNLTELCKIANKFKTLKEFLDYARKVSAASKSKKGVALSTIHSFKGMEAHSVYVVACQEGILPHSKATDFEEERNLLFVAASRPQHELIITYSGVPSPFLKKETNDTSITSS